MPTIRTVQHLACSGTQVLAHFQHCVAPCLLRYTRTCSLSALCSTMLDQVHTDLSTLSNVQHLACSGTQGLSHFQHCAASCLYTYTGICPFSALCNTVLAQVHRNLSTVSTVQHHACSSTQALAQCQQYVAPCLFRYTGTWQLSAMCSTLQAWSGRQGLPSVSSLQNSACSGTQVPSHSQHWEALCLLKYTVTCPLSELAAPWLLRYIGTCPMSAMWGTVLAQVHRDLLTVSTVQHIASLGTLVLDHCQRCAAPCLLRYTRTCPLSALSSTLFAQVHRYLLTVSTVQHLACSCTQLLDHCQNWAVPCLLRYTCTFPLSALCSTLLAQVPRYLPTVSNVQHRACSGRHVYAYCQQCATPCLLRYTGTWLQSSLCSTLLAQVHRYLSTVSSVQYLACSGTQVLAYCQHCVANCLLRYTGTCLMLALCSTLACSDTQVLAHCQHCAALYLLRYTGTCPQSALCSTLLAQEHRYLPTVNTVEHIAC
jgi:hypothetical protein